LSSNRINLLDDQIISQIAAGEVIEGPSAVLKELCENSLDAGALSITVAIESGGKKLVKVADDGFGMSIDDLSAAFKRHSTSKIRSAEELSAISTLGFRGEALASIASVARVEAVSRETDTDSIEGNRISIEGGNILEISPAGSTTGTTVTVKDLFFNTPARKKFLKNDKSESRKCLLTFKSLCLSRSDVEFNYYSENRKLLNLPPQSLKDRISDVFGGDIIEGIIDVDFAEGDYRIFGYVSEKEHTKRTREFQYLYLNGRRISDRRLGASIYSAYSGMVAQGDFPFYFLFLEMDPSLVDVNVHPAKSEVRFRYENQVAGFARRAVQRSLGIESVMGGFNSGLQYRGNYTSQRQGGPSGAPGESAVLVGNKLTPEEYRLLINPPVSPGSREQELIDLTDENKLPGESVDRFIPENLFQLHNKYIIAQIKSGMVVFDQHAAHERILFEQTLNHLEAGKAPSQKLLFPHFLELSPGDSEIFEEMIPWLEKMGFAILASGPRLYQVETVPAGLKVSDEISMIRGMLEYYKENEEQREDNAERIAASFACKAAIKAGDSLTPEEMVGLIEALFRTGTSFACPHGRPTYIRIDMREFDRRFGRLT